MYIAVLDEGYLQIEGDSYTGYKIIDFKDGIDYEITVNGKKKTVKIARIGQIHMNVFNEELNYYLAKNGTVNEVLDYNNHNLLSPDRPIPPVLADKTFKMPNYELWENVSEENYDDSHNVAFFNQLQYIQTSFINLNGEIIPVFDLEEYGNDLSILEEFDIMRIFQTGDKNYIRLCSDCGKAFIGKTTAKRCENCREEGNKRQIKENRENNSGANKLYTIVDTANKRLKLKRFSDNDKEYFDYSENYVGKMQTFIKNKKKGMTKEDLYKFAIWVQDIDKRFYSLFTYIYASKNHEIIAAWNKERYMIWQEENPELWLKSWYEKADKQW